MDCSEYSAIQGALSATLSNSISSLKLSIPGNCSNSSFCEFSSFDNSEKMEEGEVVQGFDKLFEGDNS
ncbi:hypothetical protein SS50377_25892 [Spironucleus salmonicida]|nr:hypothetical protein SS50377_25892 [Spironucleus salmonicida]